MTHNISNLPPETLQAIASYLDRVSDFVHFCNTCRRIQYTLLGEHPLETTLSVCTFLPLPFFQLLNIRSKRVGAFSHEAALVSLGKSTPHRAILSIHHRRQAFASAQPASVIVLGDAQKFLYKQGVCAYSRERQIRVLNVHQAQVNEFVIRTRLIAPQALRVEVRDTRVDLCNLYDGILTFLCHCETTTAVWRSYLLAVDVRDCSHETERFLMAADLWTHEDIIVRNTRSHLCSISPTGTSNTGRHREWVVKIWDLERRESRPQFLQIPDLPIGDLGHDLVFEIYDDCLYVVSSQSPCDFDEPQWTSFYTCFRLPLSNPHQNALEQTKLWRRNHLEGPINDLWTKLSLSRDEATGGLVIVEARKEWTRGSSSQRRSWYRQDLPKHFKNPQNKEDGEVVASVGEANQPDQDPATPLHNRISTSQSTEDPPYLFVVPPVEAYPDSNLTCDTMKLGGRPVHARLSCNTHRECPIDCPIPDHVDVSTLARSRYQAYEPSVEAFLDVVADERLPSFANGRPKQVRIRIGARVEAYQSGEIRPYQVNPTTKRPVLESQRCYRDTGIRSWPPVDAPMALQNLLNGDSVFDDPNGRESKRRNIGEIVAISDERSIIYLIKQNKTDGDESGQLILINFDRRIKFWHEKWAPSVMDLHQGNDSSDPAHSSETHEEMATQDTLDLRNAPPVDMDLDAPDSQSESDDMEDDEPTETADAIDDDLSFMPADEDNDLFWCEEYDEDEPVEAEWFMIEPALWTEEQEGFSFR